MVSSVLGSAILGVAGVEPQRNYGGQGSCLTIIAATRDSSLRSNDNAVSEPSLLPSSDDDPELPAILSHQRLTLKP